MDTALWDSVFAVNARGTMLMCKHAIPRMIEGGGGSIVNIVSDTWRAGDDFATAYACSKGALVVLTRYIATQYGHHGIRCNAISPGVIKTSRMEEVLPQEVQDVWAAEQLVGRFGTPRDIAEAVLFLASDRSAFVTGEVISVNGGLLAHMPMLQGTRRLSATDHPPPTRTSPARPTTCGRYCRLSDSSVTQRTIRRSGSTPSWGWGRGL
jgi:NAD(P)-dependent dehydrogenase (short-subunit alcohol dehydrogenase family)